MKREIKWFTGRTEILDISLRERIADDGHIIEYAVVKISMDDNFDTFRPWKKTSKWKQKKITLMCFKKILYERFKVGEEFQFEGILSFGYGSTYLKITGAVDDLDREITEDEFLADK